MIRKITETKMLHDDLPGREAVDHQKYFSPSSTTNDSDAVEPSPLPGQLQQRPNSYKPDPDYRPPVFRG
jgi:hypothetical protein